MYVEGNTEETNSITICNLTANYYREAISKEFHSKLPMTAKIPRKYVNQCYFTITVEFPAQCHRVITHDSRRWTRQNFALPTKKPDFDKSYSDKLIKTLIRDTYRIKIFDTIRYYAIRMENRTTPPIWMKNSFINTKIFPKFEMKKFLEPFSRRLKYKNAIWTKKKNVISIEKYYRTFYLRFFFK